MGPREGASVKIIDGLAVEDRKVTGDQTVEQKIHNMEKLKDGIASLSAILRQQKLVSTETILNGFASCVTRRPKRA